LGSVFDSDIAVQTAWITGATSIALVALLMLQIVLLRSLLLWRGRRVRRLHEIWQPILAESLYRFPEAIPAKVSRWDTFEFLLLWNYVRESLRDDAGENLVGIARKLGLDRRARKMLGARSVQSRLIAIQTLGWLRDNTSWEDLRRLVALDDPVVSLSSARALMRLEPERAMPVILPLVARREDWSFSVVGSMLKEAGADTISEPLARAVLLVPSEHVPRMLRFLELAYAHAVVPAVRQIASESDDLEVIAACLRIFQDPEDLPFVRECLKDERWQVRLQAAVCLGRIGTKEDFAPLVHACGDQEWWVRYRAAQSLANLPFLPTDRLETIAEYHKNDFARDILRQVIAEREVSR
jgi:HEAT repeat protein